MKPSEILRNQTIILQGGYAQTKEGHWISPLWLGAAVFSATGAIIAARGDDSVEARQEMARAAQVALGGNASADDLGVWEDQGGRTLAEVQELLVAAGL